jgi:hypothetical protein
VAELATSDTSARVVPLAAVGARVAVVCVRAVRRRGRHAQVRLELAARAALQAAAIAEARGERAASEGRVA